MSCPFPMNGTDFFCVLPGHVRFVFITSLANAFYVRTLRLEKFLAFWKALFGRISKWNVMIFYKKMVKRHWNFMEFWDLSFFQVKFWDWDILVWVDFEWLRGVRVFATENLALGQTTYAPFRWDHSGIEAVDGLNETIWNLGFWHIFGAFVIVKTRGFAFTCVKF